MKQSSLDILSNSAEVKAVIEVGRAVFVVWVIYTFFLMLILLACVAVIYPDGPVLSRAEFERIHQEANR